jgi:tRNA A-37 threonylcarbamoyl transferase component Bud32
VIADRYRLLELLTEGHGSSVYKAEHVRMGKALCVKVLRGPLARDPDLAARFRTEARAVSRLSHPHTVAVFDFGELGGGEGLYLAMEYLHGEDMAALLAREGTLPEARAAAIADQLLGALGEAHEAGIVHRDVKPANVMLVQPRNDADFVKLLDFGIAEIEGQGLGGGLGTPNYLSPEQARGGAPDARSDLYSLGALLYEAVAGRPPFVAPNPMAVLHAHLHETATPLEGVVPGISPAFAAVVRRALAKHPADRFASADEMREALAAAGGAPAQVLDAAPVPEARAEEPAEVTGELPIARRVDFPLVPGPRRKDPRRALVPGAAVAAVALAVLFAATKIRPGDGMVHEEVEPNDAPAARAGPDLYPRWRSLGQLNPLGEGSVIRASTGGDDVDVYAVAPRVPSEAPRIVLLVPARGLALALSAWTPHADDLAGAASAGDTFEPLARGAPGQPIVVRLPGTPASGAPVLLRVNGIRGKGRYRVSALGSGIASEPAVLAALRELELEGRYDEALLVAAGFAHLAPDSPVRPEVLRIAGRLADAAPAKTKGAGPGGPTP